MTWNNHYRRAEVLREVIRMADERRDGQLPMDVPGVAETFNDELTLLGSLQLRWYTALSGRLDNALAQEPMDLEEAVVGAWMDTAIALRGVRLVLDQNLAAPGSEEVAAVLQRATNKEHAMVALAAGKDSDNVMATVRAGEQLANRARMQNPTFRRTNVAATTLVERIKAVLAA